VRFNHFAIGGLCSQCAGADAEGGDEHVHPHSHGHYIHSHPSRGQTGSDRRHCH
jgi:hypothetical protein